jgi:pimeloyl-ACP methyl ester carboxylesterase
MDASATDVAELRAAMSSVAPPVLAGRLREVASVDVSTEFSAGRGPVLYIAGARDRLIGSAVWEDMKRIRPDMAITVLDAPHLVLHRKPLDASRLIAEFVAAHRR